MPAMSAGSSVANSGMPCWESCFSSRSELSMTRAERSMSSHTTAANRGGAGGFGEQVGDAAVARQPGVRQYPPPVTVAALIEVGAARFHVAEHGGDEPPVG
jgi:hypothetical protein